MALTDEQKADLQFWFYNRIFVNKENPSAALDRAVREAGTDRATAEAYLKADGRIKGEGAAIETVAYDKDAAHADGIYVDLEWMTAILREQAKLKGDALHQALSIIFKISPASAQAEAAAIPEAHGED